MRDLLRHSLVRHLGKKLDAETAAAIEMDVFVDSPLLDGISSDAWRVHQFINRFYQLGSADTMRGLGLVRDGEMVAGVLYKDFTGGSVWMHVAAQPGARWMTRDYLRYCFAYPFNEMKVNQILGWVEADNADARRFNEHLGFKAQHTLQGAGRNAADVIIYAMTRKECRYVDV